MGGPFFGLNVARGRNRANPIAGVLMVVGVLWAGLGVANVVTMFRQGASDSVLTAGLIFNGLAFVLPGLVLLGIGQLVHKRPTAPVEPQSPGQPSQRVAERLRQLDKLRANDLVTEDEFAERRSAILDDL